MTHDSTELSIDEHPFAQYVRILGKGKHGSRSLSHEEAHKAFSMILRGEATELQIGAFLMLLRVKEESPEELAGFVRAVRDQLATPEIRVDLDWSSYAGKRRHLPWFLFSILLLAQQGTRVFIHGASGHAQNRLYTEHVLADLGFTHATNWADVRSQLDRDGFCYMPLRYISPMLEDMINMRSILGLRSPVHSLSRLINPLKAPNVLQGIFHPPYSGMHQKAGQILDYPNLVVIKGEGGEIERNPDTAMTEFRAVSGQLQEEEWPAMFPRRHLKADDMSAAHMRKVWRGEAMDEYAHGAIIGTAALALKTLGSATSQRAALDQAEALWASRNRTRL
jgi:anthranilate phosphoribosyltransferase